MKGSCDPLIEEIADYVVSYNNFSQDALNTARIALFDSMGCAILSLKFLECKKRLGPFFAGSELNQGCRVPGTNYILDPVQAAFNMGAQIRWLDFNDTWLGKEWGHPSDNFGAILALGDWLCQFSNPLLNMRSILEFAIKAYEIQGVLALSNSFNRVGFDHVILVKIASAAVCCQMLGGIKEQIISAITHAFCDAGPLRAYRHAPNAGPRKSWAAGDAASRGVLFAELARRGETAIPHILSASKWGLNDILFKELPLQINQPLGCYVMEHILFKIAFPAEFHAQTAVEAAFKLHLLLKDSWHTIDTIYIETHESAIRIIDKKGPLHNPADRDHCLQYMVACGLLFGHLTAEHYEISTASNPLIDELRSKMVVQENPQFTMDYLDPAKRSIANSITIRLKDGSSLETVVVEYPLGHKMRRKEGLPLIMAKLDHNLRTLPSIVSNVPTILKLFNEPEALEKMSVSEFLSHFIPTEN